MTQHTAFALPAGFGPAADGSLYRPEYEHDACGVGFVADTSGVRSHRILATAIACVTNLTHRGAVSADLRTGDGAGVSTQLPYRLLATVLERGGLALRNSDDLGVGMVFLPHEDAAARERARTITDEALMRQGLRRLLWRTVPVDASVLGDLGARTRPWIEQVLVGRPEGLTPIEYGRRLYLARKEIERRAIEERIQGFYLPSLSNRTIVYKGLLVAHQLPTFYRDLQDPAYETALAVFHQRYSTNTFPNWYLAQPFRTLAHNGEINTLAGNRNWVRAREAELQTETWGKQVAELRPLVQAGGSDSASLDNVLETLLLSGRDIRHALMMLIPEAWENMPLMPKDLRSFYEYHACLSEPWDGPASIAFTDGTFVGATLDRNGLRPARYQLTSDGMIVMGSEAGMIALDPTTVVEKGRLGPGQMIGVDTSKGELLYNDDLKGEVSRQRPYRAWVKRQLLHLDSWLSDRGPVDVPADAIDIARQQAVFGYTAEEHELVLKPMAAEGKEPVGSMGDDTALAVFAARPRLAYGYFKQKFAQVTNPPIDPLREELVMSLDTYLGRRRSLLEESEQHARLVHLASPLMITDEIEALRRIGEPSFHAITIPALFDVAAGPDGMRAALLSLSARAAMAVDDGATILILSDRGVNAEQAPIPMLLAVGAVHHHLIREGQRMKASIIAETAEARDIHQIAALIGFGASAVNPYLAFATISALVDEGNASVKDILKGVTQAVAAENYEKAVDAGLLKIISKMGISTITGYHGAQIFEAIGLDQETLDLCFEGMESRIAGVGIVQLAQEVLERHRDGFCNGAPALNAGGYYRFRRNDEYHAFNPEVWRALHRAVQTGDHDEYQRYASLVQSRDPIALRDLLEFVPGESIPIDEVEPIEKVVTRFTTAAMSLGALSPEAHATMAVGMNRLGAKSNTGEGGEDAARRAVQPNGDTANSKIKQVASARFGVTPTYLASAEELEIKMAQGSKPGEGGQLPAHKVSVQIAALRHTLPGTPLISPPPHHDIYSIEDLAQLIYDLKMVNPRARVAVKLVAEEGIGTIAAGVAKAYADVVHISGHDGGTGASPLSSIKNAGAPFELGLAETQQVLVMNDLRGRVKLRTDGGMKTARDVAVAAMLGAEEYTFGTAAAVSVGCKMARQCHLNTCPVGVATQREDLRAKFIGTPEMVVNFFLHVAQELREILAELGYRSMDEIIGRVDLLRQVHAGEDPRVHMVDLSRILKVPDPTGERPHHRMQDRNDRPGDEPLDDLILRDIADALDKRKPVRRCYSVTNQNRTVGARVSGEVAYRYGDEGLPPNTIQLQLTGSAGQSFGAFTHHGVQLVLTGEANDYVAKGMGGGEVVVRAPEGVHYASHENTIVGNTVLYGATGGKLFVAGRAGERFAVRNSGALAVVEGVGDHGCEYMTEGVVVILGDTGRNFGAGMSNGVAYVLDETRDFPKKINPELVGLAQVTSEVDIEIMQTLIRQHCELTGSRRARTILDNWDVYLPLFWKAAPHFALTEDGPMTIVHRHLRSLKEGQR